MLFPTTSLLLYVLLLLENAKTTYHHVISTRTTLNCLNREIYVVRYILSQNQIHSLQDSIHLVDLIFKPTLKANGSVNPLLASVSFPQIRRSHA